MQIVRAYEKKSTGEVKSLVTQFLQNHRLFLGCLSCPSQVYEIGVSLLQIIHCN